MECLRHKAIAHRGLHNNQDIPENSLAAFQAAAELGFPIELDVHLTADGEIVVFHDDNLFRMVGIDRRIATCTWAELKGLMLLGTQYTIPLLREVLTLINGKVPLLLEIKNDARVGLLERRLLRQLQKYRGAYAVESFDPLRLWWFCRHAPDICRGQLATTFVGERVFYLKKLVLRNMRLNCLAKPQFIAYNVEFLPNKTVTAQKEQGRPIYGWTVRNHEKYEEMRGYCESVIFEGFLPDSPDYF